MSRRIMWLSIVIALIVTPLLVNSGQTEAAQSDLELETTYLPIAKKIVGNIDDYGSMYIDRQNGFKIVLALSTEDLRINSLQQSLQASIPADILIIKSSNEHKYPTNKLKAVNKELFNKFPDLQKDGTEIVSTYIDEELDKVIVEAKSITDATKTSLNQLYGDIIEIIVNSTFTEMETSFGRTEDLPTLGGGIAINESDCSTAGTAKSGTNKYIITAGHCLSGSTNGSTVDQNFTAVGTDYGDGYINGGQDIGLIKVTDTTRKISNLILKNGVTGYDAKYTSTGSVMQNQSVCKAGITTDYTCSTVTSTSANISASGISLPDQIKISNPNLEFAKHGDSGSILWSGEVFHGVMSAVSTTSSSSSIASASKISYLQSLFGTSFSVYTSDTLY